MQLLFKIEHQKLTYLGRNVIASGSHKFLSAQFEFTDDWDDVERYAQFTKGDYSGIFRIDNNDNVCDVPWEVVNTKGRFRVAVFGARGNNDKVITANEIVIQVEASGYESSVEQYPTNDYLANTLVEITVVDEKLAEAENDLAQAKTLYNQYIADANEDYRGYEANLTDIKNQTSALRDNAEQQANIATEAKNVAVESIEGYQEARAVLDNIDNYRQQAQNSAATAATKANEASASATLAGQKADLASASASSAARSESEAQRYRNEASAIVTPDGLASLVNKNSDMIADITVTKNLATSREIVRGKYYLGYEEDNASYLYLKEIPVKAGTTYNTNKSARFCAFLNTDKNYIPSSTLSNVTSFTPNVDGYVNISYAVSLFDNVKIYDSVYRVSEVEDYGEVSLKVKPEIVTGILKGYNNLASLGELVEGYYYTSYADSNSNYNYFKEIPIEVGKTYVINTNGRYISFLNANKQYVTMLSNQTVFKVTNANAKYMNVTVSSALNNIKIYELGFDVKEVANQGDFDIPTIDHINKVSFVAKEMNTLYKKKWAVCGDSFSNGDFNGSSVPFTLEGGMYKGKNKVYGYLIGNRNLMNIQHLAVGGCTLATPSVVRYHNCFTDLDSQYNYSKIDEDVDYITLYFGINDSHNNSELQGSDGETLVGDIPLGNINDNAVNTFYGAWNFVLSWLINNRPNAHIGIIVSNGCDSDLYRQATIACARKWGIPYIDLNGDERTPFMLRSTNQEIQASVRNKRTMEQAVNYPNNMHPSVFAHEYQSTFIENFLRSI